MSELTLQDRLRLQLAEVEMLSSMYPRRDEFSLLNASAVCEYQDFLDEKAESISASLDLCFKIATGSVSLCFTWMPFRELRVSSIAAFFIVRSDRGHLLSLHAYLRSAVIAASLRALKRNDVRVESSHRAKSGHFSRPTV